MHPTVRLLDTTGFPGFWRRSLDEFKRWSTAAIKLQALDKPENSFLLWDFSNPDSVTACVDMSDQDIGGYSEVKLKHVPPTNIEPGHAHFFGKISNQLPNDDKSVDRTGYAAWRTKDRPSSLFGKALWDVERHRYLAMQVKSDGRKYKVNVQTESVEQTDIHQHRLYSKSPGTWEIVMIRWEDFVRTNHGVIVEPQSEMLREKVRTIGVGLTDRLAGPFEFRISKIWATNSLTPLQAALSGLKPPQYVPKENCEPNEGEKVPEVSQQEVPPQQESR